MLKHYQHFISYVSHHKVMSAVVFYFLVSCIIKSAGGLDLTIPCLWKSLFGLSCPGCGLTTGFVKLLQLDVTGAFQANKLVFVVLPLAIFFGIKDYASFIATQELKTRRLGSTGQ
jgi:hypothetical protein